MGHVISPGVSYFRHFFAHTLATVSDLLNIKPLRSSRQVEKAIRALLHLSIFQTCKIGFGVILGEFRPNKITLKFQEKDGNTMKLPGIIIRSGRTI